MTKVNFLLLGLLIILISQTCLAITVSGTITYEGYSGEYKPLKNTFVRIYSSGGVLYGTTGTDITGNYSFSSIPSDLPFYVRVYLQDSATDIVVVESKYLDVDFYLNSQIDVDGCNSNCDFDIQFNKTETYNLVNLYAPIEDTYQFIANYYDNANDLDEDGSSNDLWNQPVIPLKFPGGESFYLYDVGNGKFFHFFYTIVLPNKTASGQPAGFFDKEYAIESVHEYSHAIMYKLYNENMAASVNHAPKWLTEPETAFSEGWAEFMPALIFNDSRYLEKTYIGFSQNYDLESSDFAQNRSNAGAVEGVVAKILWDIYDNASTDVDKDGISNGFQYIWAVLRDKNPRDIGQFAQGWMQMGATYRMRANELEKIYLANGMSRFLAKEPPRVTYTGGSSLTGFIIPESTNWLSWPTFHHDNRRSGFQPAPGDQASVGAIDTRYLALAGDIASDQVSRISVADMDGDSVKEIVTSVGLASSGMGPSRIIAHNIRTPGKLEKPVQKWIYTTPMNPKVPTLGDLSADLGLEVVVGYATANVTSIYISGKKGFTKWQYDLPSKISAEANESLAGSSNFMTIDDYDNDNDSDVISLDGISSLDDWPGEVYVLNGVTGSKIANFTMNNGGGGGAIATADLDADSVLDIIAPSFYGLFALEYNSGLSSKLQKNWNTSEGKINGAPVIFDADFDGEREILFLTTSFLCASGRTCGNKIYLKNKTGGNAETPGSLSVYPLASAAIANVDTDSGYEAVFVGTNSAESSGTGKIVVWDIDTWAQQCTYSVAANAISPSLNDIDGDGRVEIIYPEDGTKKVLVLNATTSGTCNSERNYSFQGIIGSAIAIADLDNDGKSEMAFKRAGSPVAILEVVNGDNNAPVLQVMDNITVIAGQLVNINATGQLNFSDSDGDNLTLSYSFPLNSTGKWLTTTNDTGNFTVVVEVSDGNLTDYQYVDIQVFNQTATLLQNFSDNTTQKYLNFTGAQNKSVQVRIPKEARILYTRAKVAGGRP